jgi:oligopeptidase B
MGRDWYLNGKYLSKKNTFLDTIACAEHLANQAICSPSRIVVRGGSAGGLTVGASVALSPTTFAGAIAEVPFVDIVSTMSDPTLPLTITEWEECHCRAQRPARQLPRTCKMGSKDAA